MESLILLGVAVTLFRGFGAEGYLISTGSMAPTLLGYHRRVVCPQCQYLFARGLSPTDDADASMLAAADPELRSAFSEQTICPNCSLPEIAIQEIPRNEGDQLLVHKLAYALRDPHRWEVIVFGNPDDPRQAYVKRVVGLPGEKIDIRDGEVYANGRLCRKPFAVQQAVAIPVADYLHQPTEQDPDWQPRWQPQQTSGRWSLLPGRLEFHGTNSSEREWLEYRHWIRAGGSHETTVPLAEWPAAVHQPDETISNLSYANGILRCRGVLTDFDRRRWLAASDSPVFDAAINDLFERSHVAPICDESGYNAVGELEAFPLNDFMVSFRMTEFRGAGELWIELQDGQQTFRTILNAERNTWEIWSVETQQRLQQGLLPDAAPQAPRQINFSLIDSQIILALDGKPLCEAIEFESTSPNNTAVSRPVRIGAHNLHVVLQDLVLSRDLYYTPKQNHTSQLKDDEFFVLGDNSPVSVDSRCWDDPAVRRQSLIGKPLFVHLPSRQGMLTWGGQTRPVRLPDFSRIRVIH